MTATDELRKQLDERGVEWRDTGKMLNIGNGVRIPVQTEYEQSCGGRWSTVTEALSGTLSVNNLTSEQAIAATLGRGECDDISTQDGRFICSKCGCKVWEDAIDNGMLNYCPDCGLAVNR